MPEGLAEKCEDIAKLTPEQREIVKIAALVEIVRELKQIEEISQAIDSIRLNA